MGRNLFFFFFYVFSHILFQAVDPADMEGMVSRDAVLSFISLLSNQSTDIIKKNAVLLLGRLSAHEQCRKGMEKEKKKKKKTEKRKAEKIREKKRNGKKGKKRILLKRMLYFC